MAKKVINLRVEDDLLNELDAISSIAKISRSDIVIQAVRRFRENGVLDVKGEEVPYTSLLGKLGEQEQSAEEIASVLRAERQRNKEKDYVTVIMCKACHAEFERGHTHHGEGIPEESGYEHTEGDSGVRGE